MRTGQRTALVLGGLGFIGSNLTIGLVKRDWEAVVVDCDTSSVEARARLDAVREVAEVIDAGISDVDRIGGAVMNADVIFDLAGRTGHLASMDNPEADLLANLVDHVHYLEILRDLGQATPVVSASTRQVIGKATARSVDESTVPVPVDVNGVSKLAWEQYLRVMGSAWGLQSVSVRLPNVYGPRMRIRDSEHGVIGAWIGQALQGLPLKVFGGASQQRNVVHVTDVVSALVDAVTLAEKDSPAYFVGGEVLSLAGIAQEIGRQAGVPVEQAPMPEDLVKINVGSLVVDDARFRIASSWAPEVRFEPGLASSLAYFREHGARYVL